MCLGDNYPLVLAALAAWRAPSSSLGLPFKVGCQKPWYDCLFIWKEDWGVCHVYIGQVKVYSFDLHRLGQLIYCRKPRLMQIKVAGARS